MGRDVLFDFSAGGGSDFEFLIGDLTLEPTAMHEVGNRIVLPMPRPVGINAGVGTLKNVAISPAGPEPAWAYRVVARDSVSKKTQSWLVGVPAGTGPIPFKNLTKFTTTIPPQTTAGMLQNWVDTTEAARDVAVQAAAEATAPTDAMVASKLNDPGSLSGAALAAAIEQNRIDTIDGVFAALDYRANRPLVLAQCSDSTGDQDNEWFETAFKESFASLWPDRAVDLRRWNKTAESYNPTEQWQTGIFPATYDANAVLYSDTFNRTGNAIGSTPEVGIPYTGTGSNPYTTDGQKLVFLTGENSQFLVQPGIYVESGDFKYSADLTWKYDGTIYTSVEIMVGKDLSNYVRFQVEGTVSATATIRKNIGGTLTTIATFTDPVFTGSLTTQTVSIEVSGTTVTAKIAGASATATLTASEVNAITGSAREVRLRTTSPDFALDNALLTGEKTENQTDPALPKVTVYNAGAAGETTTYHRNRIAAMYPEQPDLVFINQGHNFPGTFTPENIQEHFGLFLTDLFAVWQPCPVVVVSQNPEFGTGQENAHKAWMLALREYAQAQDWGYIPLYESFLSLPDGGASEVPDGLHPGIGTGRRRQANTAKTWIRERSKRP